MTTKTCFKCLLDKPVDAFYKHSMMADGHLNKCKECTKKDTAKRAIEKFEYIRSYDKMRSSMPHRRALAKQIRDEYRAKYPQRVKANALVNRATRTGVLKKQPCWVCGEKAIAHHPDYDRPLDVVWLCQPHHKQTHALIESTP